MSSPISNNAQFFEQIKRGYEAGVPFLTKHTYITQVNNLETFFENFSIFDIAIRAKDYEIGLGDEFAAVIENSGHNPSISTMFWRQALNSDSDQRWKNDYFVIGFILAAEEFIADINAA